MDYLVTSIYKRILIYREHGAHIDERVRLLQDCISDKERNLKRYEAARADYKDHHHEQIS